MVSFRTLVAHNFLGYLQLRRKVRLHIQLFRIRFRSHFHHDELRNRRSCPTFCRKSSLRSNIWCQFCRQLPIQQWRLSDSSSSRLYRSLQGHDQSNASSFESQSFIELIYDVQQDHCIQDMKTFWLHGHLKEYLSGRKKISLEHLAHHWLFRFSKFLSSSSFQMIHHNLLQWNSSI